MSILDDNTNFEFDEIDNNFDNINEHINFYLLEEQHNRANNLYKNNFIDNAIEIYFNLINNKFKYDIIYSNISACYLKKKDYINALYNALEALKYNINYPIVWARIGYSFKLLKEYSKALNAFKIAYIMSNKTIYKKEIDYLFNKINNNINNKNIFNLLLNDKNLFNKLKELKNDILNNNISQNTNINNFIELIIEKLK
jgi:tetratricopeptide (TPR) repeat protein